MGGTDADWSYLRGTEVFGPVSARTLRRMIRSHQLGPDTMVWTPGMGEWQYASAALTLDHRLTERAWWTSHIFRPPSLPVSPQQAIRWWEQRRLAYNIIMCVATPIALVAFFVAIFASGQLVSGEDAIEPLGLLVGAMLYPLLVNLCYTFGWVIEALLRLVCPNRWRRFGPVLFGIGLTFSVLLVSSPAICCFVFDMLR